VLSAPTEGHGSGLAGYSYVLDQSPGTVPSTTVNEGTNSVSFPTQADGTWYFHIRAVDNAGNGGPTSTFRINIDTTPPTVTSSADSDSSWHNHDVTVTLQPSDTGGSPIAKTQYKLDGSGTWIDAANNQFTVAAPPDGSNDGSHLYDYQAIDAAGNVSSQGSCTVNIDATPPTVTSSADTDASWHNQDVTVTLTPHDTGGSQVAATQYKLDGASSWTDAGNDQFIVPAPSDGTNDGLHTYDYQAIDGAGNVSVAGQCTVRIDTTAPITTVSESDSDWHNAPVTLDFSAVDHGSGMSGGLSATQYQIDSGPWTSGSSAVVAAPLDGSNDGSHTVSYYSTDACGNPETPHAVTVKIDTTPPITNVKVDRDATSGDVSITFLPSDLGSGMVGGLAKTQYAIDGGPWVTGTQVELQPLSDHSTDGPHTLLYRSTDAVGNVETARSVTVTVATPGPGSADGSTYTPQTTVLGLTGLWRSTAAHLTFQAYEDPAGPGIAYTEYSLDNGTTWERGTALLIAAPADHSNDGPHLVCYRSVDNAGTVEPTHIVVVGIDTQKPTVSGQGLRSAWSNKPLTLAFDASDPAPESGIAQVQYSTTGGSWWTAGDQVSIANPGVTQVLYRAIDDAGNVGDTQVTYARIDTSRPWTKALRSSGRRLRRVALRFRINDAKPSCSCARVTLIVIRNTRGKIVARYRNVGFRKTNAVVVYKVRLRLHGGSYRFSVRATDIAGNVQSRVVVGRLVIR
jgi:hypothetical protein